MRPFSSCAPRISHAPLEPSGRCSVDQTLCSYHPRHVPTRVPTACLQVLALIAAVVELSPVGALGTPLYACASALWCTLMAESWKRRQATLAHEWGMVGYENEERPRPEFIAAFHKGLWAADHEADPPEVDDGDGLSESNASMRLDAESKPMVKKRQSSLTKIVRGNKGGMERRNGFYDRRGFVPHDDAPETLVMPEGSRLRVYLMSIPTLVLCTVLMLVVTLGILTFRMLMSLSRQLEEHPYFNPSTATTVGALLNTLWITVMNMVYAKLAAWLNDLENHRTDTEHEDALIVKTFLFQFANSYIVLFYIAFIQGLNFSLYGAFGYTNAAGQAYHDMCGLSGGESGADSWAFAACKGPGGSAGVPPPTAGDPLDASNPQGHCERAIFVEARHVSGRCHLAASAPFSLSAATPPRRRTLTAASGCSARSCSTTPSSSPSTRLRCRLSSRGCSTATTSTSSASASAGPPSRPRGWPARRQQTAAGRWRAASTG